MVIEEQINDFALWEMLQEGDRRGIELLYRRYYLLMLNYGLKLCTDREIVKDAIQDIFVKLHLAKKISTPTSPRSYLLRAVRNTIYDMVGAQSKYLTLENTDVFNIVDMKVSMTDFFSLDDKDTGTLNVLNQAYSKLNFNQKQIIYLRYLKELSFNEIADVMDMNRQSAMNLVQRSLVKLRSLMALF